MDQFELVPPEATAIVAAPDDEAMELERSLIEFSDNGWCEGDPLDQPDNMEEARTDD